MAQLSSDDLVGIRRDVTTAFELAKSCGTDVHMEAAGGWNIRVVCKRGAFSFSVATPDGEQLTNLEQVKARLKQKHAKARVQQNQRTTLERAKARAQQDGGRRQRVGTPTNTQGNAKQRVSARQRFSPLSFWAGERVVYEQGEGGSGARVAGVIRKTPD
jgi:hypothetical protein